MTAIVANAGSLAKALSSAELPVDRKAKNAAALGAVHLSGDGERLRIIMTGVAGTITIEVAAKAEGETALPLQRLTALVFPPTPRLALRPMTPELLSDQGDPASSYQYFRFPTCQFGMSLESKSVVSNSTPQVCATFFRGSRSPSRATRPGTTSTAFA